MTAKKYHLTPEHEAQLPAWRDKWIANAMSTQPMTAEEKRLCIEAVNGLYKAAGLEPPKNIVFVPSPFVMRFAGGFASGIWHLRKTNKIDPLDATDAATYAATRAATLAATRAATDDATYAATLDATYAAKKFNRAPESLRDWYDFPVADMQRLAHELGGPHAKLLLDCAYHSDRMCQGGNQWSAWDSFLSFFRHIALLPLDYSKYQYWETLAMHSGPRLMHPDFCMISDRPVRLTVDASNQPHNDEGPFCQWSDGSALYAVHGVRVPAWIVELPEKLTPETIQAEKNTEIRRVMMSLYGWEKMLTTVKAKLVDRHPDPLVGELWRWREPDGIDVQILRCLNGTPDPLTGGEKWYSLRVPLNLTKAVEASKWTYPVLRHLSNEDYLVLNQSRA